MAGARPSVRGALARSRLRPAHRQSSKRRFGEDRRTLRASARARGRAGGAAGRRPGRRGVARGVRTGHRGTDCPAHRAVPPARPGAGAGADQGRAASRGRHTGPRGHRGQRRLGVDAALPEDAGGIGSAVGPGGQPVLSRRAAPGRGPPVHAGGARHLPRDAARWLHGGRRDGARGPGAGGPHGRSCGARPPGGDRRPGQPVAGRSGGAARGHGVGRPVDSGADEPDRDRAAERADVLRLGQWRRRPPDAGDGARLRARGHRGDVHGDRRPHVHGASRGVDAWHVGPVEHALRGVSRGAGRRPRPRRGDGRGGARGRPVSRRDRAAAGAAAGLREWLQPGRGLLPGHAVSELADGGCGGPAGRAVPVAERRGRAGSQS